jgi:hypothetical protein
MTIEAGFAGLLAAGMVNRRVVARRLGHRRLGGEVVRRLLRRGIGGS